MMSENPRPARAVPPGRIITRELEARGWSQKDLAEIMGRPPQAISEIVRGRKQIVPDYSASHTAWRLAAAFGVSPELWINLETNYRLYLARKAQDRTAFGLPCCTNWLTLSPDTRDFTWKSWMTTTPK